MLYHLVINGELTGKEREFRTPPDFTGPPTNGGWLWKAVRKERAVVGKTRSLPGSQTL